VADQVPGAPDRRPRIIRLIGKWLKAGTLEEGKLVASEEGTPQGAVISPLLANIYLHYVFDLWAHQWRHRHARGNVVIVRYADDIVVGVDKESDARRFVQAMRSRLEQFKLTLHPEKTQVDPSAASRRPTGLKRGLGNRRRSTSSGSRTSAGTTVVASSCCSGSPGATGWLPR
jgi:hypothetical protein